MKHVLKLVFSILFIKNSSEYKFLTVCDVSKNSNIIFATIE